MMAITRRNSLRVRLKIMKKPLTAVSILVIAALLLVVLAVIEFLGRPETAPPSDKPADEGRDEGTDEGVSVPEQRAGV